VELLLAGVPVERVSILLGHQSVRIYREAIRTMGAFSTGPTRSGFGERLGPRSARTFAERGTPGVHGRTRANKSFIFK
jgi:hypothetical protein